MATTLGSTQPAARGAAATAARGYGGLAYALSGSLALVAAVAAGLTAFAPGILTGPPVMNGSARGTALVTLFLGVPALLAGMASAARGWDRAPLVWLGALAFLAYNGVMFLLGEPFNHLFLAYEAMLSLAIWSTVSLLRRVDVEGVARPLRAAVPARAVAVYCWVVFGLNVLLWLRGAVPAVLSSDPAAILAGTGVAIVPTYFQDLAFWLPLALVAAGWLWRRNAWGYLVVGALLVYGVVESASVALDQWLGSAADPASTVASAAVTPVFAALAVVGLVPLYFFLVRRR